MFKELLSEVFPLIEKVAPALGSCIAGPMGGIALTAVASLAKVFGTTHFDIPGLVKKIQEDPEAETKISVLEQFFNSALTTGFAKYLPSEAEINIKLKWNNSNPEN